MSSGYIDIPISGGGAGVSSLNGQTGALSLVAGSNITITPGSGTLTIATAAAAGANVTLSNLTAPTAINQDLIFSTGSAAILKTANTTSSTDSKALTLTTGSTVDGNSGVLTLSVGTASGTGTRGKIKFQNGSEGTTGHIWTSTDTLGSGGWAASVDIPLTQKGAVNGVATLDSGGHIPLSQLPSSLVEYQGTWDASTNTPTLSNASGIYNVSGYFFITSTGGTVDFGAGAITFNSGDWALFDGTVWERAVQSNVVQSVNGAVGVVTVNAINQLTGDVTAGAASQSQSKASTVAKIQGTTVSGTTGSGNVVFSASPTLTGTITAAAANLSGALSASNFSGSSSGTNTGDITLGTANGLSLVGQALSLGTSSASTTGALTSADWSTFNSKGSGTVTAVSVASANGFAGSSSGGATPALTLTTSVTGVLKGNGTSISAATSGTDYSAGTSGLATGILKSTTTTGALTIAVAGDFPTLNQNTTGTSSNVTGSSNSTLTTLSALTTASSLVSVGTITSGTWNGTLVAVGYGGTGTSTAFTLGSVVFAGASGVYTQDNANFFWDNTNKRLGLATASPATTLDVSGTIRTLASREGTAASANSSTAYSIPDISKNIVRIALTGNTTLTLPDTSGISADYTYTLSIRVTQDATGSRTLAWATAGGTNTIKWDGGAAIPPNATANKTTFYQLTLTGSETVWYGSQVWKEG